jgi:carbon monoxide dehydrogenase subunit G
MKTQMVVVDQMFKVDVPAEEAWAFLRNPKLSGKLAALGGGSVIKLTSREMARQFAKRVKQRLKEQAIHAQ